MIRKFQPSDLEAAMDLWLHGNTEAHDFISKEYWKQHFDEVKEMLPKAELYVYENDNTATFDGFIGLSGSYIAGIFVKGNARSQGIGKQLLDYVKAIKGNLTLKVYERNQRAVKFYQREGFFVQSQSVDEDTGQREYVMSWQV
ncbi:MAG: N-acetyltransferase [Lachnospiraceae bacterium]|nr:N-acetyltransferase [Lachnospiraceae bacterium]